MAEELAPGIELVREFDVDDRLITDLGGRLTAPVLSTPGMVGMMEGTAVRLVAGRLPHGKWTVGFEICVKHVAPASRGARCTARALLREVIEGRKLHFDVEVREGDRVIGTGTHERRVIDLSGFES